MPGYSYVTMMTSYMKNFNLFFGVAGWYDILKNWSLVAELDIRPAGSLNQLAVRYESYVKLGVKYKW